MYREIEHKADIAYEIEAESFEMFLKDVVEIILKNSTELSKNSEKQNENDIFDIFEGLENEKEEFKNINNINNFENVTQKCYNINKNGNDFTITDTELEDFVFDTVNDIITMIDRSFYPQKVEDSCIYFKKGQVNCQIKALTYHNLLVRRQGNKLYARMVFDV